MTMFFTNYTEGKSNELTFQLAKQFASASGDRILAQLVENEDVAALVAYPIDYTDGCDPIRIYATRQCLGLFSKRDDISIGIDVEQVALDKFLEAESECKSTNIRITKPGWQLESTNCFSSAVLFAAEEKISQILGELPNISDLRLVFGPGASTTCKRNTTARWKLSTKPACSSNMLSIVEDVLDEMPHYTALHADGETETGHLVTVEVVNGRLMFVPKNAKTKRSIMVEPLLNSFLQKGYGQWLKSRLLRAGINLYDQTHNQRRAWEGSRNNSLATVDLSSASDTISIELVRRLLPSDWFWALDRARTSRVDLPDGSTLKLEKFSSMGNAFTFELESLIFYALTYATCVVSGQHPNVSVYGDDIICPVDIYDSLCQVFSFCGFSINKSKSFANGPFRESCGADYYMGTNVRPFYQKTTWSPATLVAFHNFLVRGDLQWIFPEVLELILENIEAEHMLTGPDGYGDGHLIETERYQVDRLLYCWDGDQICNLPGLIPYKRGRGWSGYVFDTFVKLANRVKTPCPGDRILPTYSIYVSKEGGSDHFAVSGSRGAKRISVYTLGR